MITVSDNTATDRIYGLVGDQGLHRFAQEAGMSHFAVAGRWDLAQITAADQARFFYGMDDLVPAGYRPWVCALLASVNRYRDGHAAGCAHLRLGRRSSRTGGCPPGAASLSTR